jgi:hypothetical protein
MFRLPMIDVADASSKSFQPTGPSSSSSRTRRACNRPCRTRASPTRSSTRPSGPARTRRGRHRRARDRVLPQPERERARGRDDRGPVEEHRPLNALADLPRARAGGRDRRDLRGRHEPRLGRAVRDRGGVAKSENSSSSHRCSTPAGSTVQRPFAAASSSGRWRRFSRPRIRPAPRSP